jgi:hypothetical protein
MATTFKTFLNNDIASTRTMLHEAIPITGSLVSGTYGGNTVTLGSEPHIKNYSHGMFQSVYDYPYLSSSANHIFDIAIGVSPRGDLYSSVTSQQAKKANIYNQMAQILMGHSVSGTIQDFDEDGNILAGGTKLNEVFFLNFARLLAKDEVKKGSFQLELGVNPSYGQALNHTMYTRTKLTDASGSDGFFVNSPAGEYGILYAQSTEDGDGTLSTYQLTGETDASTTHPAAGLIFYQAGIAVISGSVFNQTDEGGILVNGVHATLANAIDCDVFEDDAEDDTIVFNVPTAAGGEGETTILLDSSVATGGDPAEAANTIAIAVDNSSVNTVADLIIAAINGTTNGDIDYASSGNGTAGVKGLTAAEGSSASEITLTAHAPGVAGNLIGVKDGEVVGSGDDYTAATSTTYKQLAGGLGGSVTFSSTATHGYGGFEYVSASTIETTCNAIRNRIYNLSFNNSTELNSSIYFCRINHNDFNYSSNPTYLSGSKIRVKNSTVDNPVTYLTTVGLYSADNELLAVAKVSEPLKKDPSTEMTLRVRLDY